MAPRSFFVAAAAVALFALAAADSAPAGVVLLDSPARNFLRPSSSPTTLSGDAISTLLSALLGIAPAVPVTPEVSRQVDVLSQPDLFYKPSVVLSINVAGIGPEEGSAFLQEGRKGMMYQVSTEAAAIMQGMDALFSTSFQQSVAHYPLDHTAMQGCDSACVEESISKAAARAGGAYTPGSDVLGGVLQLGNRSSAVELDLSEEAERMYAMEMANLQKTAENAVAEAQAGVAQAETKYMDCTMMGLQMLRGKYGAQSEEFKAAYKALLQLAGGIMDDLCSCHEDRVVGQIALLGDVGAPGEAPPTGAHPLIQWRQEAQPLRARVLQEASPPNVTEKGKQGQIWSIGALTWTAFWVLLWFIWVGVYALCTMSFKADSLLYGKSKAE